MPLLCMFAHKWRPHRVTIIVVCVRCGITRDVGIIKAKKVIKIKKEI